MTYIACVECERIALLIKIYRDRGDKQRVADLIDEWRIHSRRHGKIWLRYPWAVLVPQLGQGWRMN